MALLVPGRRQGCSTSGGSGEPEKAAFSAPGGRGLEAENESLAPLPTSEERSKTSAKSQAESSNNKTDPLCAVKTGVNRVLLN